MKTTVRSAVPILLLLFATASCSRSPKEKAVSVIVYHLEKNLKDPSSYIPVHFKIEEQWTNESVTLEKELPVSKNSLLKDSIGNRPTASGLKGWKILHKFRSRSESGMIKDTQLLFYINSRYQIEKVQ